MRSWEWWKRSLTLVFLTLLIAIVIHQQYEHEQLSFHFDGEIFSAKSSPLEGVFGNPRVTLV